MVKYIGLTAGMGCGKSTAVTELKNMLPQNRLRLVKFAAPLYDCQEHFYNRIKSVYTRPKDFTKNRAFLQFLGTQVGREIDEALWIKLWKAEAEEQVKAGHTVISDDTRFDNEAETIRSLGGVIIQITSDRASQRIDTKAGIEKHQSEAGISKNLIDYTVRNDNTIEEFRLELRNLFEKILSS